MDEYFRTFRLVEVQQTFYEPPQIQTVRRWRAAAPADFEFTLKAWQLITHPPQSPTYRRLRTPLSTEQLRGCGGFQSSEIVQTAWARTRAVAEALGARRVLFQCPARFTPAPDHVRSLREFFRTIDRGGLDLVWEPRGDWPASLVRELCEELGLTHAVDPFRQAPVWGEIPYYRLHGLTGYRHRFTDEELEELRARVGRGPAYVLFNNVSMREDALRFLARVPGDATGERS
ncbi:DUF72 domain-containing protein [Limisphaera sp. VF-2]|jgi:uncharacterized protein YecE (DUF72 family)|uniref:DUF72 domain-containing protein n=1 Tax=Limisphaera sp. VF-2 TaxID=3400418 RepID=UPI0017762DBA